MLVGDAPAASVARSLRGLRAHEPSLAPHPGRQRAAAGRAGAARPFEPAEAGPPPAAVGPGPAGDAVAGTAAAGPEVPGGCTGGAPLPRRRVGTRRRRPTRRGGVPGRCGLRRRGHAARRRRARDAAPQTRLFARLPPLHRVRRAAAGDRLRPPARRRCVHGDRSVLPQHECTLDVCGRAGVGRSTCPKCCATATPRRRRLRSAMTAPGPPSPAATRATTGSRRPRPHPRHLGKHLVPFRDEPQLLRVLRRLRHRHDGRLRHRVRPHRQRIIRPETLTSVSASRLGPTSASLRARARSIWPHSTTPAPGSRRGELLLFLNNDIEAQRPGWGPARSAPMPSGPTWPQSAPGSSTPTAASSTPASWSDDRCRGHPLLGLAENDPGYMGLARRPANARRYAGACLAPAEAFEQLEGFDETLGVDLNDVDYPRRALP